MEGVHGPNFEAARATLLIENGNNAFYAKPERRFYPSQKMTTTESAIHTNGLADFYTTVGEQQADGKWVVRMYYKPLAPWIWLGALVMAFGGTLAVTAQRRSIRKSMAREEITDVKIGFVKYAMGGIGVLAALIYWQIGAFDFIMYPDMNLAPTAENIAKIQAQIIRLLQR
jgi:hypothetical protein